MTVDPANPSQGQLFKFTVKPLARFFGDPRVITVNMRALQPGSGGSIIKTTPMTITVTGTEPDDGKLDHFTPTPGTPVPQTP